MRRTTTVRRLADHPNRDEIVAVLTRIAQVSDSDLARLAPRWRNDAFVAAARARALMPDSILICDVLAAFDEVAEVFRDDLVGEATYITLDPEVASRALKAVRDAIAGCYAKPTLSRAQHRVLLAPWKAVFGDRGPAGEPDLGPQSGEVQALLAALPRLAQRCHDKRGSALWDALVDQSFVAEGERVEALAGAFDLAVRLSRRRVWTLVRRTGAQLLETDCRRCPPSGTVDTRERERVAELCLAAACALLVADELPVGTVRLLTGPVSGLLPHAGSSS